MNPDVPVIVQWRCAHGHHHAMVVSAVVASLIKALPENAQVHVGAIDFTLHSQAKVCIK